MVQILHGVLPEVRQPAERVPPDIPMLDIAALAL
jgi:hypothetical protein